VWLHPVPCAAVPPLQNSPGCACKQPGPHHMMKSSKKVAVESEIQHFKILSWKTLGGNLCCCTLLQIGVLRWQFLQQSSMPARLCGQLPVVVLTEWVAMSGYVCRQPPVHSLQLRLPLGCCNHMLWASRPSTADASARCEIPMNSVRCCRGVACLR
jgi:hypothetical protein